MELLPQEKYFYAATRENDGLERERPVYPLGYVNHTKVILDYSNAR